MSNTEAKITITAQDKTQAALRSAREGMRGLESAAAGVNRALGAIGVGLSVGAVVTGLGRAAMAAIEFGDEVQKAAKRTGLGASAFAELAEAARLADVDMATLSKGLRTMQVRISEAGSGAKAPIATFKALGLEVKQLIGLDADEQLELLFEQISKLRSPTDRARAGVDLFGRSWDAFAPIAAEGAAGLRAAREEVERLGGALTDKQIEQLAEADDAIKRMTLSWNALARTLAAQVGPELARVLDSLRISMGGGSRIEELRAQIDLLKEFEGRGAFLSGAGRGPDIGTGFFSAEEIAAKRAELERKLRVLTRSQAPGGFRQSSGSFEAAPPGFEPEPIKASATKATKEVESFASQVNRALDAIDVDVTNDVVRGMNAIANETRAMTAVVEQTEAPLAQMSVFADEAARQMQTAFAQFFYDFDSGLDGMLAGFADTLRQMVAQMAASKIFDLLGAALGGSGNAFIAGIGSFISGARATGGPVIGGSTYLVGERGPELFTPSTSGTIMASGYGGVTMNQSISIDARGADAARIMSMLPAWSEQIKRQTVAEVINLQRRGRLA